MQQPEKKRGDRFPGMVTSSGI